MERENARRVESEEQLAERRLKLDYEDLQAGARLAACTTCWDNTLAASAAGVSRPGSFAVEAGFDHHDCFYVAIFRFRMQISINTEDSGLQNL